MNNSNTDYLFLNNPSAALKQSELHDELVRICHKIRHNMAKFGERFPSACTENNIYRIKDNDDWTNGFWTGMQTIAYEFTGEPIFLEGVKLNILSFEKRLQQHWVLDHHDIGFLYSLSIGAYRKITNNHDYDTSLLAAADVLLKRYHPKAGFIQAWGVMSEPSEYRLIIDSLINLPLLYTATEISSEEKYREAAQQHFNNVVKHIFRDNYSSHHTYFFDPETGEPLQGKTFQGFSDSSCWARGQAWAILGLPLNWRTGKIAPNKALYDHICHYFYQHLPEDGIPYWDLSFTAADNQSRDTSALAIVICGLLEADKFFPDANYHSIASTLLSHLMHFASATTDNSSEGILKHGVYAYSHNKGIDECNLWGDYYYMESLYRLYNPTWKGYW